MPDFSDQIADVHIRLGRLEKVVDGEQGYKNDSTFEDVVELLVTLAGLVLCFYGFGLPNHYYQGVFAILIVIVLYHSGAYPYPRRWYDWGLAIANVLILCMLLKLVIGGGEPKPFYWISYPVIEGGLTSFKVTWQQAGAAHWALPLTTIQTFFLVLSFFGALIGFELFSGLTAFVLVLLSLPALFSFDWNWALPGMIAALFSFYLQRRQY